ncbi:MAG: hypothetical protein IJP95_01945 [Bacteroidales bacterium]|nr:hypothetical protein [Bacteroidales bacterium]
MDTNSPQVEMLKRLVEERSMLRMDSFKDFQLLYDEMRRRNNETLGVNTLRRLWGDISGYPTVREATLGVLCRFVGYTDWHTFVADYCGMEAEQTSCDIATASLQAVNLTPCDRLTIAWNPNRSLHLEHLGYGLFRVLKSENSRVKDGDTFHAAAFAIGQPLYMDTFVHNGEQPKLFVVGKKGGLTKVEWVRDNVELGVRN